MSADMPFGMAAALSDFPGCFYACYDTELERRPVLLCVSFLEGQVVCILANQNLQKTFTHHALPAGDWPVLCCATACCTPQQQSTPGAMSLLAVLLPMCIFLMVHRLLARLPAAFAVCLTTTTMSNQLNPLAVTYVTDCMLTCKHDLTSAV